MPCELHLMVNFIHAAQEKISRPVRSFTFVALAAIASGQAARGESCFARRRQKAHSHAGGRDQIAAHQVTTHQVAKSSDGSGNYGRRSTLGADCDGWFH